MINSSFPSTGLAEVQGRVLLIKIGVLILVGLLVVRLWQLQVRDREHYRALSYDNRTRSVLLQPIRGLIYDRNGVLLANNVPSFNLYVQPDDVPDREALTEKLSELLSLDENDLRNKIQAQGRDTSVRLKKGLSLKEAAIVESYRFDLPGVVVRPEFQRHKSPGILCRPRAGVRWRRVGDPTRA